MAGRIILLGAVFILCSGAVAAMCGAAYTPQDARLSIEADSRSLLVYNADTDLERYVLQPAFTGNVSDFGYVVPTPSLPVLDARDEAVFRELMDITDPQPSGSSLFPTIGGSPAPDGVTVVDRTTVGDFDATVLQANASTGLLQWLRRHDYHISNASRQNLAYYADSGGYYFTALRINASRFTCDDTCGGRLTPIELRFRTGTPYVPLRILRRNHTNVSMQRFQLYTLSDQPLIIDGARVEYANVVDDGELGNYSAAGRFLVKQEYRVDPAAVEHDLELKKAELFHVGTGESAVVNPFDGERNGVVSHDGSGYIRKHGGNMQVATGTEPGLIDRAVFVLEAVIPLL